LYDIVDGRPDEKLWSDQPLTNENKNAVIQVVACIDKNERAFIK
jgi:hypothetical protein